MPKKSCLRVRGAKACVQVDPDILLLASRRSWHMHQDYPATTVGSGKKAYKLYLHRFVTQAKSGTIIDHANGDHLDNRRTNLRLASKAQNTINTGPLRTNKSGMKGVVQKGNRFRAFIHKDGKTKFLGSFENKQDAACEYNRAAKKLFGKFAKTNPVKCPR
jgi:hypothetical protein